MTNDLNLNILPPKLFNNMASDIRTRVVLQNEVSQNTTTPGMAGKVGLIGAFPSSRQDVVEVRNYPEFLSEYGLSDTKQERDYEGVKAIGRIFMKDFPEIAGASSVVCVNTNEGYTKQNSLTVEVYESLNTQKEKNNTRLSEINTELSAIEAELDALNKKSTLTDKETERKSVLTANKTNLTKEKNKLTSLNTELDSLNSIYESDITKIPSDRLLTWDKLVRALHKLADENIDLLFIADDLWDCVISPNESSDRTPGHVYEKLLDFIENKFSSHQALSYIGWIRTEAVADNVTNFQPNGTIGTNLINVYGNAASNGKVTTHGILKYDEKEKAWDMSEVNTSSTTNNNENWGAFQIAQIFTKPSYELATCGLFFQGATINKEKVGPMELAAHICGWLAGLNVSQDLTYQTIPGVTGINEELYFGPGDAGEVLNNMGIQIIKPKNRLEKTFFINNSVNPSGWHTNHIRSVNYLLNSFAFEAGLGMNNFSGNIALFKATLDTIAKQVMSEVDLIRSVVIGEPQVKSNYHLYVPVDIILAGVITKISVGVSMTIEDNNESTSVSTTGYNFYY